MSGWELKKRFNEFFLERREGKQLSVALTPWNETKLCVQVRFGKYERLLVLDVVELNAVLRSTKYKVVPR